MKLRHLSLMFFLIACDSDKGITVFNPGPQADISSHSDGDEVLEGMVITFEGNVTDANHQAEELTATWKSGTDILCEATVANSDGTTVCEAVLTPDDTEITLEVKDAENSPASDTIAITVIPSANPVAEILTPETDEVYYSDQLITFEALLSDEEDDADLLIAVWNSNVDGDLPIAIEPNSAGELLGATYLSEGDHFLVLSVEDTTGKEGSDNVTIRVGPPNSVPLCEITGPIDGSAGPEGDSIQFVATVSDVDVPSDMLTVTWSSDKDGDIGSSTPTSAGDITFSYFDLSVNQHNITMTVTDEVGATCTTAINYTVGTPPSITIDAPVDSETYSAGDATSFSATVSDAQDQPDEVLLDWSLNGTSVSTQGSTSTGTAEFSDSSLAYGAYNLVVTATDTDGLTDSDQINFTVNGLPSQPNISINPDPAYTDDGLSVVLDTDSVDPEGSTVNYSYEWLLGGSVQSTYTSSTIPSSATSKGEQWMVRVTPNDGIANGTTGTASITISNSEPSVSSVSITPAFGTYNDIVYTCSATIADADETPTVTYEWTLNNTVLGTGTTLDAGLAGLMPDDIFTCTIVATDSDGATASDSGDMYITNRFPVLSNTNITPNTGITTSSELVCASSVSDDDGESLIPTYEWSVGINTYSGATLTLTPSMVSPGDSITCSISVEDGYGGSDTDSTSVNVENTPPVIAASVSVIGGGNTGELTCSAVASDVDDDPTQPTISYEWLDNSGASLSSANPLQLDSSMGTDGDEISCVATATDLSGGTASDTAVYTITNTPPVIDSISISPASPDANTTALTCTVTGSDADGDAVTFSYEWLVDNTTQTETSTIFSGPFIVGSMIACRSIPNDGKIDGNYDEDTVTIRNTVPVVDSVSLSSSTVYTNDTITTTAVFSDDDSTQTVSGTYAWHVIDVATGTDNEVQHSSDNTLSGVSHFDRDDAVYVVVTPNDGVDDGSPMTSSSITISNTAPSAPGTSISPDPATAEEDLTCLVDTVSTDDDGDSIVYTYVWTDDLGTTKQTTTATTATSDTFAGSSTTEGTWICAVTSNDGTDDGPSDSTSVTIGSELLSASGYNIKDFDVAHDGSVTAVSFDQSTGEIHAICFDQHGSLTDTILIETVDMNVYNSISVRVGRAADTHESAIGWHFYNQSWWTNGYDWQSRHAHLDASCNIVAAADKLDPALGDGILRNVDVEISDDGTSAFVYENQSANQFRLLYFDASGVLINAVEFGAVECGRGALTRVLGMNRSNGKVVVGCESTSSGVDRYYQRFDNLGNTIDAQMIEVSAASGYGSWHNFATQMNDNDHVVYIAKDSSNIWTATFYDANGLELAVVNTGITSQSERILVTSDGDFVLGGSGYREVYSQDGILLGNSSLGGSIRLDGYDVVYLRSSSEVIEYDPFSLY